MAKKDNAKILPPVPAMTKKALAEEKPLKLDMSFQDAIKKMVNTPVKKKK